MEVTKDMVRKAVQALCSGGNETSYQQVYEALGLSDESRKAIVRTRISDMRRHGEVVRVRPGVITYNAQYRRAEGHSYVVMWRYVRASKPGWTINDCCMMTRVSYTHAMRYIGWLEGAGHVERAGRNEKRAVLYRRTQKAARTPETPYPPTREADPFQQERAAAATIARLMLCADPHAMRTARAIVDAANVLLARFSVTKLQPLRQGKLRMETATGYMDDQSTKPLSLSVSPKDRLTATANENGGNHVA